MRAAVAAVFCLWLPTRSLALDPAKTVLQYNCQTWTRQSGLPVNAINAIAQTKDGYMWLGTSAGLVRFDGIEFKVLPLTGVSHARNPIVSSLAVARNGGLWVGLDNSAFGLHDGRTFSFRGKSAWGGEDFNVRSIMESSDGTLWFTGEANSSRLAPDGVYEEVLHSTNTGTRFNAFGLYQDSHDRVWLGTAGQGAYSWHAGQRTKLADPALDSTVVYGFAEDASGRIFVGTLEGLYCYDSSLRRTEILLPGKEIRALLIDRQGVLWVGTTGHGLFRYSKGVFSSLQKPDGLAGASVKALAEDREGSLWIGTQDGLSHLTDVKFPTLPVVVGASLEVLAVGASPRGGVWAAHSAGVTYFDGDAEPQTYFTEAGLPAAGYKRVFEAKNGDVYVVGNGDTLSILSGGKMVSSHRVPSLVVGIAEDAEGVVVSVAGALYRAGPNYFTPYPFPAGKAPDMGWILNLMTSRDGALWVSSVYGIFRIKNGTFQHWGTADGMTDPRVMWLCEDSDGVIWGALLSGIVRLKYKRIHHLGREQGLLDNNIYAIIPDDLGNLWIDSSRGIFQVNRQSMNECADGKIKRVECVAYDNDEAVKPSDKHAQERLACKTLDGRIWFPSAKGVIVVDPSHIPSNPIAPPVFINRVVANGTEAVENGRVVVPPGRGELEVHFTALSFLGAQRLRFRYQLEGYDTHPVETQHRRLAIYTNLKPGHYVFRVTAANQDGVWNNVGDTLEIELRPHFYQTTWFHLVSGGLALGGLMGVYRRRVRLLKGRERALQQNRILLETEVQNRTAELRRENIERKLAEEQLRAKSAMLEAQVESSIDGILVVDTEGRKIFQNQRTIDLFKIPREIADEIDNANQLQFIVSRTKYPDRFLEKVRHLLSHQTETSQDEIEFQDGVVLDRYSAPVVSKDGKYYGRIWAFRDITERKRSEAELEKVHRKLLETSRQAGMAEVATGVLHNVGNVLNSVNVSATLVTDRVRQSKAANVGKLAVLLEQHKENLVSFLTEDPRGKLIPAYLGKLAESLTTEHQATVGELEHLRKNIDHIKDIVTMQQAYAKTSGVTETVAVLDMIEDALRVNVSAPHIDITRDYQVRPVLTTDKHKVMQILINLVRNAKHACDESGRTDKQITVRVTSDGGCIQIAIVDNGVGIPAENLTRIFGHGFTTRKDGHGFGLHSGALAAKELGGSLNVHSDGPDHGATFTLELPSKPISAHENSPR